MRAVYLDNNATTRVDDRVAEAMLRALVEDYGNPSSIHHVGARAAALVENARASVAGLLGCRESEIVFLSGGTESDNAAIRGVLAARPNRRHVVISAVEHSAVFDLSTRLEAEGCSVSRIPVDQRGQIDLDRLAGELREDTALVSVMLANNETGVIMPVRQVAEIARRRGSLVHTDAVQAVGKIPVRTEDLGVDLLSLSGHKIYAPKGVGALFIRRGTPFRATMLGGHQERDRRGGTQNTAGIVGLGVACELIRENNLADQERIRAMRDRLEREVTRRLDQAAIIGADSDRLPNTSLICFGGVEAEALLILLSESGICASSGAACSSGSLEPSRVLQAMGVDPTLAHGEIRFSLGRYNTDEDVDALLETLPRLLSKLTALNVG